MQAAAACTPLETDRIPARSPPALLMASFTTPASRSPMSTFGFAGSRSGTRVVGYGISTRDECRTTAVRGSCVTVSSQASAHKEVHNGGGKPPKRLFSSRPFDILGQQQRHARKKDDRVPKATDVD